MTPHDSLFHFAFRWVRHARSRFRSLFAPSSHAAVDWTSMLPAPEKVRGRQLRLQVTDLLFDALLVGNQHRLFLAPEHNAESPQPKGEALSAEPEVVDARRAAGRRTVAARDGLSADGTRATTTTSCTGNCSTTSCTSVTAAAPAATSRHRWSWWRCSTTVNRRSAGKLRTTRTSRCWHRRQPKNSPGCNRRCGSSATTCRWRRKVHCGRGN